MNKDDIDKVFNYIEENLRVTEQTTIEYLDSKGNLDRLALRQNHIIFGRRGSGKSLLLKSLKGEFNCINVNLEDYKDVSFPDSIIQVLKVIIYELICAVDEKYNKRNPIKKWKSKGVSRKLKKKIENLNQELHNPDTFEQSVKNKNTNSTQASAEFSVREGSLKGGVNKASEVEVSKDVKVVKLNSLKIQLPEYKKLFTEISEYLEKDIYLILDDFYFIRKSDQASFLDFFHRLSKNTPLFLKVATIKHRSLLYTQTSDSYIGIEIPHDAQAVNLDYSLEDFPSLISFMKDLLNHINEKVDVSIDYRKLITENAFSFLCLASGGVPRDFLSLLISLRSMLGNDNDKAISKPNVIEKAIENLPNKMNAFKTDAAEELHALESHLNYIQNAIITEKKWNSFLVSNAELQKYPQINQTIKELVDLRFLHLINPNVSSANSDGTRYSAYMIDIGLFPNANPRDFQQVEPGKRDHRAREDKIRSAPKLNLIDFNSKFEN